ncbi:hypothetical protein NHP194003_06000 [Helicobacter suis]|uniref:Uncharacterized protein n=1 Tax=Helicobacter suis TaxID=104628 RepID=A0A6J4CZX0_9HELI|nr:hypothetical protein [Helicobacter suis]BCD46696.1 hypothetical protein NHP190020_17350 [Helicobacter suis]BCD47396.1 hypothetical protein NHP194003_06000 [Helicobacter suis]BCD49150.1 hypothetical protein NHP194004_05970 [Helicobacter suis]BCD51181.1 hypothetical protein NHP194022_08520 [Helicobacter suis]BCD71028.1 hypothetical protein SNTW_16730 [Helicobacter suis]
MSKCGVFEGFYSAKTFCKDKNLAYDKKQLKDWGVAFLELKDNKHCINDFRSILKRLHIPHKT